MRLVADESVEGPTIAALRKVGHKVLSIAETSPGIEDKKVLAAARREKAVLLTADKDFGELVFRNREKSFGVLLLRLEDEGLTEKAEIVVQAIGQYGKSLRDFFSVLSGNSLRMRRLGPS